LDSDITSGGVGGGVGVSGGKYETFNMGNNTAYIANFNYLVLQHPEHASLF
jgi:hypothetical protein